MNKGRNPVLPPDICVADGEAHVFGQELYIYGSRDFEKETYCSDQYNVISTKDMMHWDIHEKSFDGNDVPWIKDKKRKHYPVTDMNLKNPTHMFQNMINSLPAPIRFWIKISGKKNLNLGKIMPNQQYLFAPDCIEKDGKYFLYFCMADNSEGVAVAEKPEGPFEKPYRLPCGGIDPAIFIDDDGKAYYYWGQFRACGVPLNADMISFDAKKTVHNIVTEEDHGFHEGSSMRKRNGIYYYVYPCVYRDNKPTCLAYATSTSPLGPFTYQGIIIDNAKCDPKSWNIHGSIEEFLGQWYVFYHRSSENSMYHRRLCVEKIDFNEDGTITEVKMTSIGAGKAFERREHLEGWRACEVENGAYIKGTDLIMCDGSKAVFRYIYLDMTPQEVITNHTGNGKITVLANGQKITDVQPGTYEITVVCEGNTVLHSITVN